MVTNKLLVISNMHGQLELVYDKRVDGKRLSINNHVVKLRDFRGAMIDDLNHHLALLLKKKPEHIILHIETNNAVSKTSR